MTIDDKYLRADANNFTALRLFLASSVIYTHSYWRVLGVQEVDDLSRFLGAPISTCAVDGFFFLSGFLVYPSLLRMKSALPFLLARLTRLWPALAVSVILTALGGLAFTQTPGPAYLGPETSRFLACNLSFACSGYQLTGVICADQYCDINGSLWTLPWEARCYLALAALSLLGLAAPKRMMWLILPATLLGALLWDTPLRDMASEHLTAGAMFYLDTAHRLWTLFALGAAAYLFRHRIVLSWWALIALAIANAFAAKLWFPAEIHALFIGYAVLCLGLLTAKTKALSGSWPDYSYGTYIFAFPIMMVLYEAWKPTSYLALAAANLALTLPLAALSWHFVEKPALNALRDFRRRRAPSTDLIPTAGPATQCAPPGALDDRK
jgi:peptidoglycan/LPS O-acetylase OafA/YrhL